MPRFLAVPAVAALLLASSAPAHAQTSTPASKPASETASEPKTERPEEITVVGGAPPRSASESSRDQKVVGAAPHRTGGDVLLAVPGVFVTQHGGQGKAYQIFFRGFDSVHGQDLAFDVGGVPVNEVSNLHGQGYADLHFVMPEVVSEVRSTPGTYSPRQGDFAVAGSIHFDLGYAEPGVTAKAGAGSFGERRLFLAYHPEGAAPSTFGAFEAQSTHGFGPARAAQRTSAIAQHVFALDHGLSLRVLGNAYASRFDSAGVLLADDLGEDPNGSALRPRVDRFATYDPRQGGASSRTSLLLDLSHAHSSMEADGGVASGGEWSLAPFVILRALRLRQNFTGFLEHPVDGDSTQQQHDATTLGSNALYRKPLGWFSQSDTVEAGLGMRTDWIEQSERALGAVDDRVLETRVDAKIRATNAAGFLDLALKPLPRLGVRGGFRVDALSFSTLDQAGQARSGQIRAAMGTHLGPKLTVDARAVGALHVIASYGEGFRSPQARSLGDGERTPFTKVRSAELGLRYREARFVTASASAFYTTLSGDLVFDPRAARNEPVPGTRRVGFAMEYVLTPRDAFVSSGSATYTHAVFSGSDARYRAGDLLPYVPQWVLRQDLAYTPELGRLGARPLRGHFGAALTGLFNRPLPYGESVRDVFLVDLTASVRLSEVELGLDVFNALGAQWFDGAFVYASNWPSSGTADAAPSLVPQRHVTVGAPRTALATLTVYL